MTSDIAFVRFSFSVAVMTLLLAVAVALAFSQPARRDKRLLACYLFFTAASEVYYAQYLSPLDRGFSPYSAFRIDALFLSWIALAAFFWDYPAPARLRSWEGIAVALAGFWFVVGIVLWTFARESLIVGASLTLAGHLFVDDGVAVAHVLLVGSALSRARSLPPRAARAAAILAPGTAAWLFGVSGTFLYVIGRALARGNTGIFAALLADPIPTAAYVATIALAIAIAVRGSRFALALVALGILIVLVLSFGAPIDFFAVNWISVALAPAYAVIRYGDLGTRRFAPRALKALAATTALVACLLAVIMFMLTFGDSPLAVPLAIFIGIVSAGSALAVVVPRSKLWREVLGEEREAERYHLVRELGGASRLCRDVKLDRLVVTKRVRDDAALRAARLLAARPASGVLTILDVEDDLIVVEYAEGGNLETRTLDAAESERVAREVARAVESAGLGHQSVKPSNVLFTREGSVRVSDLRDCR